MPRRDREQHTLQDLARAGTTTPTPPIILDPVDGLPRPADELVDRAIRPVTDESLVCTEGGEWMRIVNFTVSDRDDAVALDLPDRVLAKGNANRWSLIQKTTPAKLSQEEEENLSFIGFAASRCHRNQPQRVYEVPGPEGNLVVRSRPACAHYHELAAPAEDLDADVISIHRVCLLNDMVLTDGEIHGCLQRRPRDLISEQVLVAKAREKAKRAKEAPTPMFKEQDPEERAWLERDRRPVEKATTRPRTAFFPKGGKVLYLRPLDLPPPAEYLRTNPVFVLFPDAAFQPSHEGIYGCRYFDEEGVPRVWAQATEPTAGALVGRLSLDETSDPSAFQGMAKFLYEETIKGCVQHLRNGKTIVVVPYHQTTLDRLSSDIFQMYAAEENKK